MPRSARLFIYVFFTLVLFSCNRAENEAIAVRLAGWDAVVQEHPRAIADSLAQLNPKALSRANRAYHGLLKTMADDKTFADFTSDSLINSVHRYYQRHKADNDNHIRSLVYQGIVRNRMGEADSTVFAPLKEAERLYLKQKQPNRGTGYMLYYYLGDIHSEYDNYKISDSYFTKASQLAKQKEDSTHTFDAYLRLYWNEMVQKEYDSASNLLDSLNLYVGTKPDNIYFLLHAQSTYYNRQGRYKEELKTEKAKLILLPHLKEQPSRFRQYYTLSEAYLLNNLEDSAMYYALQAVSHIEDSTYKLNYLLYENVAEIAERQQNLSLALEYRKKALNAYEAGIDNRLDTRILELEKRYNLSEAENKALKAQQNVRIWLGISFIIMLLLALLSIYTRNQRAMGRLKEREAAEKASRLEAEKRTETEKGLRLLAEKEQMKEQTTRQQKILEVSVQFLAEYAALQEKAREMVNRVRAKDGKLGDEYERMLKQGQQRFNNLAARQFTEEELTNILGVDRGLELLSQTDRLLLIMLAAGAPNTHIAAMLNTTVHNLKTRKSYLKAKIEKNATPHNNFAKLLALFNKKLPHTAG